jgi:hypothetical protein
VSNIVLRGTLSMLVSILFYQVAQAQSGGYPLVCRSGGGMQLSWSALFNARTNFIAYFDRAPNAAGTSAPLQSGQCAWIDRPMNAGEAGAMLWNLDATVATTFKANGPSTPVVAVTGGSDMARAKLFVDYVRTSGAYFTATVYNSNAGYMVVTDFRGGR